MFGWGTLSRKAKERRKLVLRLLKALPVSPDDKAAHNTGSYSTEVIRIFLVC